MRYLNNQGHALLLTILTIVLISVMGLSLLTITANSKKTTVNERFDQSTYYIAEAGINLEKAKLTELIEKINDQTTQHLNSLDFESQQVFDFDAYFNRSLCSPNPTSNTCINNAHTYNHFQKQFSEQPIAKTVVTGGCSSGSTASCTFDIRSEGYFENSPSKKRVLTQKLNIALNKPTIIGGGTPGTPEANPSTPTLPFDNVTVFTTGPIHAGGNATILGAIGTTSGRENITLGKNMNEGQIQNVDQFKDIDLNQYLPPFPKDNSTTAQAVDSIPNPLTEDIYLKNLDLGNKDLTINLNGNDVTLYVDSLESKNHANLIVQGTGKLNIFIKNTFDFNGEINPNGVVSNVNIFYNGTTDVALANAHSKIFGSMYIKNAGFSSNGALIYGNIYSAGAQTLNITGNSSTTAQYIIAPNAKVEPGGGGVIKGAIIAKELGGNGNYTIEYPGQGNFPIPLPVPPPSGTPAVYQPADNLLIESTMGEI